MAVTSEVMGGAEAHAFDLAQRLHRRGHTLALLLRAGVEPVRRAALETSLPVLEARTYPEVAAHLEAWAPDVVQHFNSTLVVAGLDVAEHPAASVQVLHANHRLEPQFRAVSTDEAHVVVAVSDSAARFAPPGGPTPRVVWTGIDVERFSSGPPAPAGSPLRVLCVGRIDEAAKRPSAVLAACQRLPEGACNLTFIGDGPDADNLAARLPPWARLKRAWIDPREAYRGADVLVSASPTEGFGLAIAEAAACGLAIVARRAHGVTEQLVSGHHASLVDDEAELGGALLRLSKQPALRLRLGRAARQMVQERLSIEDMVAGYEAAHAQAILLRRGRGT